MSWADNHITRDAPDVMDLQIREEYEHAPGWLPVEQYDLVQLGYPRPDHGSMVIRPDGGSDGHGRVLPSTGMWVKAADVRPYFDEIATLRAELAAEKEWPARLAEALRGLLAEPYGCPFCDSGKLRKPHDPHCDHNDDCPYAVATALLSDTSANQPGSVTVCNIYTSPDTPGYDPRTDDMGNQRQRYGRGV